MKLFGFNISRSPVAQRSLSPAGAEWLRGQDQESGGAILTNAYQQVVWVYRAINAIAEQVATAKHRPAPGFLEGYRATVMGILTNEAVMGRKRVEFKPQMLELA
jgi:hypothetical protein